MNIFHKAQELLRSKGHPTICITLYDNCDLLDDIVYAMKDDLWEGNHKGFFKVKIYQDIRITVIGKVNPVVNINYI